MPSSCRPGLRGIAVLARWGTGACAMATIRPSGPGAGCSPSPILPILAAMPPDTIEQLLVDAAARRPDAVAVLAPDRNPLTYGGLARVVGDVGTALRGAGVARRDRAALGAANGPEAATAFLAIAAVATAA